MSKRENARAKVLSTAQCAGRKNKEIAQTLGLSARQVQRLKNALREEGPAGLAHGNRGAQAAHATPEELAQRVVGLYKGEYVGFNFGHFHEKLLEVEGLGIC